MSKISNVLTMIEYLSSGRKYSISELSKKLEVSPRMIRVYKDKKEISTRIIHPYDLILLGSEWGVAAYCEKKQEIRHFYINRIKEIKLLENLYN